MIPRPDLCTQCVDCQGLGGVCSRPTCGCHHLDEDTILDCVRGAASPELLRKMETHASSCELCLDLLAAAMHAMPEPEEVH